MQTLNLLPRVMGHLLSMLNLLLLAFRIITNIIENLMSTSHDDRNSKGFRSMTPERPLVAINHELTLSSGRDDSMSLNSSRMDSTRSKSLNVVILGFKSGQSKTLQSVGVLSATRKVYDNSLLSKFLKPN